MPDLFVALATATPVVACADAIALMPIEPSLTMEAVAFPATSVAPVPVAEACAFWWTALVTIAKALAAEPVAAAFAEIARLPVLLIDAEASPPTAEADWWITPTLLKAVTVVAVVPVPMVVRNVVAPLSAAEATAAPVAFAFAIAAIV